MSSEKEPNDKYCRRAAEVIGGASSLLLAAGAGMGVDSGLPDFRGPEGFWNAYPPLRQLGLNFYAMASQEWFGRDPELAWGFYGHRLNLYRRTSPHRGFTILRRWSDSMAGGCFVFTSNVDGSFQKAGFDPQRVLEAHGSIHYLQRWDRSDGAIYPAEDWSVEVDESRMRAIPPLPREPDSGALLRPNILMFGDYLWNASRTEEQENRYADWLGRRGDHQALVILEIGAGGAVPTVRYQTEAVARRFGATLIRVNPREPEVPEELGFGIGAGALSAIERIDSYLEQDTESS
jgi:NAD-dependent SIR2 family protein deacetylase